MSNVRFARWSTPFSIAWLFLSVLGCNEASTTPVEVTESKSPVCEGDAFSVTLDFAGTTIEGGELQSRVVAGSVTGGLVPDQESPNDSYRYDYICVDAGRIDISYDSASSSKFSYSGSATINCEPCIPDGLYEGTFGAADISSVNITLPNGNVASVTAQAGEVVSTIYDHQAGAIALTVGGGEVKRVEIAQTESGDPSAIFSGFTTGFSVDTGDGFPEPETLIEAPGAALAPIPDTGEGEEMAVGLEDYSVWRLASMGSTWDIDADRSAGPSWITGCAPGLDAALPYWVAAIRDFMLLMLGDGRLCHGWFGVGGMGALALEVGPGVLDLKCPPGPDGDIRTCGVLTEDDLMIVGWDDESQAPTLQYRLGYCADFPVEFNLAQRKATFDGGPGMGAVMTNDDEACFAIPCGNGAIEEICVGVSEEELRFRTVLELAGCGKDCVTYVNEGKIATSCDEGFQVATRPALDMGTGGTGGMGTGGTGGTGNSGRPDEPLLLHPCDVFTEAEIEALTGTAMVEERLIDNENRRICVYSAASDNGMTIDMEAQQNTASADFYEGWKERNADAVVVERISWSPEGELRVTPDAETLIFAFVINDDPIGRDIFINMRGFPIGDAPASPALVRSVVETTSRQLNDAILVENGLPLLPGP